jgi:hypothetical protein
MTMPQILEQHISAPLGIDLTFGLEHHRFHQIAPLTKMPAWKNMARFMLALMGPSWMVPGDLAKVSKLISLMSTLGPEAVENKASREWGPANYGQAPNFEQHPM